MTQPPTPNSPLDGLLSALRSAATTDELSGEATAVQAMAFEIADSPRGTFVMKSTARARRIVSMTAIGVLGFAGVAAAGRGVFVPDNRPTIDTTPETTAPVDTVSETTMVDDSAADTTMVNDTAADTTMVEDIAADTTLVDVSTSIDSEATEVECAEGNHGKTVSSVARETEPGPDHGATVSEAARSDCGKDSTESDDSTENSTEDSTADSTEDSTEDTTEDSTEDTTEDHDSKPSDSGSRGNGHKPSDPGSQGRGKDG